MRKRRRIKIMVMMISRGGEGGAMTRGRRGIRQEEERGVEGEERRRTKERRGRGKENGYRGLP